MKVLKPIIFLFSAIFLLSCNQNPDNKNYQSQLDRLNRENDSLKKELAEPADATQKVDSAPMAVAEDEPRVAMIKTGTRKTGKHPISLQWIGWSNLGSATVKPIANGWYKISGSQKNKAGDYLTINGKLRRVSEKELVFNGEIVTKVGRNNGGEPCLKEGNQTFLAKGSRSYFRLQEMTNCEGGMLVDYVDIYTGSSSL